MLDIRIAAAEIAEDVSATANQFQFFTLHLSASCSLFSRSFTIRELDSVNDAKRIAAVCERDHQHTRTETVERFGNVRAGFSGPGHRCFYVVIFDNRWLSREQPGRATVLRRVEIRQGAASSP